MGFHCVSCAGSPVVEHLLMVAGWFQGGVPCGVSTLGGTVWEVRCGRLKCWGPLGVPLWELPSGVVPCRGHLSLELVPRGGPLEGGPCITPDSPWPVKPTKIQTMASAAHGQPSPSSSQPMDSPEPRQQELWSDQDMTSANRKSIRAHGRWAGHGLRWPWSWWNVLGWLGLCSP